ncbi:hypothetical protein F511_35190 [Dorcoceras hygrometricum]|uniref:Uncharacterized protein n=1 Tax=Dorcoceras hygrometricum TaxID=472368 RepID=A0A2Z7ANK2_9LAMI|nr:hypothetical protein F511_35190 [Dorcoceras hygrometricum]
MEGASRYHGYTEESSVRRVELEKIVENGKTRSIVITTGDFSFYQLVMSAFVEGGKIDVEGLLMWTRILRSLSGTLFGQLSSPSILLGACEDCTKVNKFTILNSDRSVDSDGKKLLELIKSLALMVPYILMTMGVQNIAVTQWNIVRPTEFPKNS